MTFEEHLAREIVRSERTRAAILAGLFGLLMVVFPLFALVFREEYARHFGSTAMIGYALGGAAALVAYELLVRAVLGRQLDRGRGPPAPLRFLNAFVETSVPSILIVVVAREIDPMYVLQSAASLFYAVFIVLSTLRLDFRLCVFTGLVAAAEYVVLSRALLGSGATALTPFEFPPYYVAKGAMLLLAGFAAGFVALQLKARYEGIPTPVY